MSGTEEQQTDTKREPASADTRQRDAVTTTIAWIALVVASLALAGGIYLEKEREKLKDRIAEVRESVIEADRAQLRRDAAMVRVEALQRLETESNRRLTELDRRLQTLDAGIERLRAQAGSATDDWILAEVEHVLQLAMQHLELERDPAVALVALRVAERRMRDSGLSAADPVILRIAQDIAALEQVDLPDRVGITLTLDAIANRVTTLPLMQTVPAREIRVRRDGTRRLGVDWSALWQRIRQSFFSMITVRRGDRPVAALLPADQEAVVFLSAQLKMDSIRLALIQRDTAAYRAGIRATRQWLDTWFDGEDDTVRAIHAELDALSRIDIAPDMPDIGGSLRALRAARGARR